MGMFADAERTLFVEEHHWLFIHDQRENLRYVYAIPAARNATDLDQVLHVWLGHSASACPSNNIQLSSQPTRVLFGPCPMQHFNSYTLSYPAIAAGADALRHQIEVQ